MQDRERRDIVGEQHGFGDFEFEPARGQAGCGERLLHRLDQPRALELHRRDIHPDADMSRPIARLGAGAPQHQCAERDDEADLFGERDEFGRHHEAARRVSPSRESLEAADAVFDEIVDRLIMDLEFVPLERIAQVEFERTPRLQPSIHLGLEEAPGSAPVGLGPIERDVRVLEQRAARGAVSRRQRNADARADRDSVAGDVVGGAQDFVGAIDLGLHDGEFVAAEPRNHRLVPRAIAQTLGDRAQQFVADMMAERIVDLLESVEIEAQHGKAALATEVGEGFFDLLGEQDAVGQAGQRVMARHEGDARFRAPPLGDVFIGRDPAAIGHRLMNDRNDAAAAQLLLIGAARMLADEFGLLGDQFGRALADIGARRDGELENLAEAHAWRQALGGRLEDFAEAAVDDHQPVRRIEEAETLGHVVERRVEADVRRLQLFLLVLQFADVAPDGDRAAVLRRALADAQPAPIAQARLARRRQAAVLTQQWRVVVRGQGERGGKVGDRRARPQRVRGEAEKGHRLGVGERDAPFSVDDHDAFARAFEGVGEPHLRRAPCGDLALHHGRYPVAHDAHRVEQGAELVRPPARDRSIELARRDAARDC